MGSMMGSMTLACDLDGVVFDFDRAWVQRHRAWFGSDLQPNMPQDWNELHLLAGFPDPTAFWSWWYASGGFRGVPLHEGARQALRMADLRGWSIVYVTNRPADLVTERALEEAWIPQRHHLIHTQAKWEIPAHLWVEDSPLNLGPLVETPREPMPWVLRVERPWNRRLGGGHASIPNLTPEALLPWLLRVEEGVHPPDLETVRT